MQFGACRLLALALVVACGRDPGGESRVARLVEQAAGEARVPADLLLAVAFAESRLSLQSPFRRKGWIQLLRGTPSRGLDRGAALIGASPASVAGDPELGLRAAAALLGEAARETRVRSDAPPLAWRAALERFNGGWDPLANQLYADQILAMLGRSFEAVDGDGRPVVFRARGAQLAPRLSMSRPPDVAGAPFAGFVAASALAHRQPGAEPRPIRRIVIHTTEGSFSGAVQHVRRPDTEVSSHYIIRSWDGLTIQLVDERRVAFHCGCFNDETIGIEHEGYTVAGRAWYGEAMYLASARLVADIATRHAIPLDRQHILGHGEAPDCSDHVDPGPDWDWNRYMRRVAEAAAARR